jgi:hypothetical protein
MTGAIGTIRSLIDGLTSEQSPTISPRHVLIEAHLLRLLAENLYWNLHDSERWRGAPRCGRVPLPPDKRNELAAPCGREHGHTGECRSGTQEDLDDVIERVRTFATAAGRLDHAIASMSLAINRRRYDGAAVDTVTRETLRTLPTRLINIASGALDVVDLLEQASDIQRWVWTPPPDLAPPTRRSA